MLFFERSTGCEDLWAGTATVSALGEPLNEFGIVRLENAFIGAGEEFLQRGNEFAEISINPEIGPFFTFFTYKQTRPADHLNVTGNRGLRHFQNVRELADAQGFIENETHDAPAGGITQCAGKANDVCHHGIYCNEKVRYVKIQFSRQSEYTSRPKVL
jgi:hypothetical protein